MENSDTREPKPKTPQRPRSNSKKESGTPTEEKVIKKKKSNFLTKLNFLFFEIEKKNKD